MSQKMDFDFLENQVNPKEPLLYRITIGDARLFYVGSSNSAHRPKTRYKWNVGRMMDGKPYHKKSDPRGYRRIHRELLAASLRKDKIVIELLCNVPKLTKSTEERKAIQEHRDRHGAAAVLND
jgi:hypothetical protein